jgi:hypothetical protein
MAIIERVSKLNEPVTRYTDKTIRKLAIMEVVDMRHCTGHPAKLDHWELIVGRDVLTLAVIIQCYDGLRQRNIAI